MEITCPDGSSRTCNAACPEDECHDNSKKVCGNSFAQTVGQKKKFKCLDGSVRVCDAGTEGCGRIEICKKTVGYEIEITCRDGVSAYCQAGTKHCKDNDWLTCAKKPQAQGLAQTEHIPIHLLGDKTPITCADGSVRVCNAGTEGCYKDGSICDEHFGYEIEIKCEDNTTRYCQVGTLHCTDNDAVTCAKKPESNGFAQTMDGEKTAITCADGSVRVCSAGTNGCTKSGSVCDPNKVGYETQISCPDGSK